jgi:membrane-associated phospholipid phosphatase
LSALWGLITDCGDAAVTLPLALLVLVFLLVARERRLALHWSLTVIGCAAAIGALKLLFGACTSRLAGLDIVSPSGHTAMSTAIYGSLALLIAGSLRRQVRPLVLAAAVLLIAAIGVSRVMLQMHDAAEVAMGLAVGVAAVAFFGGATRRQPAPALPIVWLVLGGLAVVIAMHGTRLQIEPLIHRWAGALRAETALCR